MAALTLASAIATTKKSNTVKNRRVSAVRRGAEQGVSIIVISSELPEVLAVSDHVLIIKQGRVNGGLGRAEAT
jgi:ABC-type sugar transport system ATPase subunit